MDLLGGARGNSLGVPALLLDKTVDRPFELHGLSLRCSECKLCLMLPPQLARAHSNDPVLACHGGEPVV